MTTSHNVYKSLLITSKSRPAGLAFHYSICWLGGLKAEKQTGMKWTQAESWLTDLIFAACNADCSVTLSHISEKGYLADPNRIDGYSLIDFITYNLT